VRYGKLKDKRISEGKEQTDEGQDEHESRKRVVGQLI
jgi:hypothetical protein